MSSTLDKMLKNELFELCQKFDIKAMRKETKKSLVEKLLSHKIQNPGITFELDDDVQTLNDSEIEDSDVEVTHIERIGDNEDEEDEAEVTKEELNGTENVTKDEDEEDDDEEDEDFTITKVDELKSSLLEPVTYYYELSWSKFLKAYDFSVSKVSGAYHCFSSSLSNLNSNLVSSLSSISTLITILYLLEFLVILLNFTPLIKVNEVPITSSLFPNFKFNLKVLSLSTLFKKLIVLNVVYWILFQILLPLIISYYIKFKLNFMQNDSLIFGLSKILIFYFIIKNFQIESSEYVSFNDLSEISNWKYFMNYFENFNNFSSILGNLPFVNGAIIILISLYI